MKYYTLLEKHNGRWLIAFGDYERATVVDERADLVDSGQHRAKDLKIISTGPSMPAINAAVDGLNNGGGQ